MLSQLEACLTRYGVRDFKIRDMQNGKYALIRYKYGLFTVFERPYKKTTRFNIVGTVYGDFKQLSPSQLKQFFDLYDI